MDQLNYMVGELSQSAGIRAVVHNPDSYPMIEEFGLDVMPGTATSMSLQLSDIVRLPDPHPADCYGSWEQTDLDRGLMNPVRPRYDKTVCTRYCLQHQIMRECDCFNTQYDLTLINVTGFEYSSGEARPCDLAIGSADIECMDNLLEAYDEGTTCPTCHSACRLVQFSKFMLLPPYVLRSTGTTVLPLIGRRTMLPSSRRLHGHQTDSGYSITTIL